MDLESEKSEKLKQCGKFSTTNVLDKLTLEMFMNNNYFTKYLAKSDPTKYQELCNFQELVSSNRSRILDLTQQLLDDNTIQINKLLQEKFHEYVTACIKYLDMRDMEGNDADDETYSNASFDPDAGDEDALCVSVGLCSDADGSKVGGQSPNTFVR